jgi:hypothetical protein
MGIYELKNMKKVLFSLFLIGFSSCALAKWTAINESKSYFYDPSTFSSQGKYAKVWGIINYEDPVPNGYPKSKKFLLESDCLEEQVKTLMFIFTADQMGKGEVMAESNQPFSSWRKFQPNSIEAALFNISCRSKISNESASTTSESVSDNQETLDEDEEIVGEIAGETAEAKAAN